MCAKEAGSGCCVACSGSMRFLLNFMVNDKAEAEGHESG